MCVNPEFVDSILAKIQIIQSSNLHGFELHRPSSKGTKLLLQVTKAIVNQSLASPGICEAQGFSRASDPQASELRSAGDSKSKRFEASDF